MTLHEMLSRAIRPWLGQNLIEEKKNSVTLNLLVQQNKGSNLVPTNREFDYYLSFVYLGLGFDLLSPYPSRETII